MLLSEVDGNVDVANQSGSVEVAGITAKGPGGCHKVTLTTSFAPIKLTLPSGAGFNVSARTSFGRVQSAVPITTRGPLAADSITGTLGGGGCDLSLSNSSGDITLLSAGLSDPQAPKRP